MKRIKNRVLRMFALLLCAVLMAMPLTGCDSDNEGIEEGKTYVYYVDKDIKKIVPKEYEIKAEGAEEQLDELLDRLKLNTDDIDVIKAIPDEVKVEDYYLDDGVLSISFSSDYTAMKKEREVLSRAAIVMTMTQLSNVSYVAFSISGVPLAMSNGEAIGNMQASDFADNLNSNKQVYNTEKFTIYFANQAGSKLVKYDFEAEYGNDMSREQVILNKLIAGPGEEEGYTRTLPSNLQIVSVMTMDNICYITFGENFLTEAATVPDDLVIYSIVNSLSEMSYIHKVQISVNGQVDAIYHGTISLAEPFTRNLDYIEKLENTNIVE